LVDARTEMFLEDFDDLFELHSEYADSIDSDNFEARAVWEEIEGLFKPLSRRVARIRRNGTATDEEIDDLDTLMESLNELYADLSASL